MPKIRRTLRRRAANFFRDWSHCAVALGDDMRRRREGRTPDRDQRLHQVNAVINAIVAGEFPLMGVRWKRIEAARDLLRRVLAEEKAEASR